MAPLTGTLAVVRGPHAWRRLIPFSRAGRRVDCAGARPTAGLLRLQHQTTALRCWAPASARIDCRADGRGRGVNPAGVGRALTLPDGMLHVWFLDVGHGNAI